MLKKLSEIFKQKSFLLCLTAVFLLGGCSAKKLQTVKIEAEANQIIDVLGENGIKAKKNEVGEGDRKTYEVLVNGDDETVATAIQLMEDHCLGQPEPSDIQGGTVITSIEVEQAREQRRMKMNIESQLRNLPGATCVNVNFVPPQDRTLAINPYPSTASVTVYYKTPAFPVSKEEIAGLVARSIPALLPENVVVVLIPKPLRPLPDNKATYNVTRIALVSGIGFATVLAFVSIVFMLRKKSRNLAPQNEELMENNVEEIPKQTSLIDDGYDFDDDDDDENLP
jgi:type III secretory pathway lipoprotein EscJ